MKLDIEKYINRFSDTKFVKNPVLNVIRKNRINDWLDIIWIFKR